LGRINDILVSGAIPVVTVSTIDLEVRVVLLIFFAVIVLTHKKHINVLASRLILSIVNSGFTSVEENKNASQFSEI
jgi:hypothetical protein